MGCVADHEQGSPPNRIFFAIIHERHKGDQVSVSLAKSFGDKGGPFRQRDAGIQTLLEQLGRVNIRQWPWWALLNQLAQLDIDKQGVEVELGRTTTRRE